ncbi:MAG: hypothetical protein GOVbin1573_3 [Prokaryotic dsDNA virus sp.]|nr:MAG: hypothetical protein GOVbin1573_3 [Prokaryotic dsDNA virus sp.]|tara:strand:- start:68 stop:355 length:288 start_codon:yes stop_codon:yes gene_type:complete
MPYPDDFNAALLEAPRWAAAADRLSDECAEELRDVRNALRKIEPLVKHMAGLGLSIGALGADEVAGLIADALEGDERDVAAKNRETIRDHAKGMV